MGDDQLSNYNESVMANFGNATKETVPVYALDENFNNTYVEYFLAIRQKNSVLYWSCLIWWVPRVPSVFLEHSRGDCLHWGLGWRRGLR